MEAIVKVSEVFNCKFESNKRLLELHAKAKANYMKKYTDQERKTVEDPHHSLTPSGSISLSSLQTTRWLTCKPCFKRKECQIPRCQESCPGP